MKKPLTGFYLLTFGSILLTAMSVNSHQISAPAIAAESVLTARAFLAALSSRQRGIAQFEFDDPERFDWHYVPRSRAGLALKDMTADQLARAHALLKTGLSTAGYQKAVNITRLEAVLAQIEFGNFMGRDPGEYYFSVFGRPAKTGTWGWRVEGHHLSLNFTIVEGRLLASAPRFLGANPAEVPDGYGDLSGTRTLAKEEDTARALLASLDQNQLRSAVFSRKAYRDIVSGTGKTVSPLEPVGISAAELNPDQKKMLTRLIGEYASTLPPEIARQRMQIIAGEDPDWIHFGWAGGLKPGQPHYYRIQGRRFLVEYDNVQNGANHIHTVWRDFDGDFGRDILREHYRAEHH